MTAPRSSDSWRSVTTIRDSALVVTGCHTTQPDLKPPKQPEVFSGPPTNFSNNYPKQAFNGDGNSGDVP